MSTSINRENRIFSLREAEKIHDAAFLAGRIKQAEEDAEIARSHKGKSRQDRETKRRPIGLESLNEILTEERGEDIAAEIIADSIRANAARLRAEGEGEPK